MRKTAAVIWIAIWLVWPGLAVPSTLSSSPSSSTSSPRLTLLVTSGLSGRLAYGETTVATVAAEVRRLADTARARGDGVVVFDAGRTLLPAAESRRDGGRVMSEVLAAAGCQAFVPEAMDFTLGLDALRELTLTAPYPVLRPFVGFDPRLEAFASYAVLTPQGGPVAEELRMALVSVYDYFYKGNLAKSGIAAELHSPTEALAAVPEEEPALRVAVVHSAGDNSSMLSRQLTWELVEEPRGYDLVIDPDFGHDLVLRRQDEEQTVLLIGRRQDPGKLWTVAEIVVDLESHEGRWRPAGATLEIHAVDDSSTVNPALDQMIRAAVAEFRQDGARLLHEAAPVSRAELIKFVLDTVREAADAEVSILNLGVFEELAPRLLAEKPLSVEAVRKLLALDQFLVAGELTGAQLRQLHTRSRRRVDDGKPRKSSLVFRGLALSDRGKLEVNGRQLYPEDRYRVVTNSFLASGGDDYPALVGMEQTEGVRIESGRLGEVREDFVLPRLADAGRPFVDLERRGLWRYGVDRVGMSLEGVRTSADSSYQTALDSRASASASASLLATIRLRADQEWRNLRWENRLRGRFGLIDSDGESTTELEDDLRLEISALFTGETFLGAQPYASLIFDSEFRRNKTLDGELLPRQLEQNLAAGLRWQTASWPLIRLGLVARHQSDFEDADRLGVFAEAELSLAGRGRWPGIEGRFFAESLENSAATIRRFDAEVELQFPLGNALAFTPEFNFYLYDDSRLPGAARYHRLSLGLAYTWAGKYQRR